MKSRALLFAFVAIFIIFAMQSVNAGVVEYDYNMLNVYKSTSTTLGSGELICGGVSLINADECLNDMNPSTSYRFETIIKNISSSRDGNPTEHAFSNSVGAGDVLGALPLATSCGCEGNSDWGIIISGEDVICTRGGGGVCQIDKGGEHNVNFWFLIVLASDPGDGSTATFYVTDGSVTNESTLTTFNIGIPNNPPTLDILVPDGGGEWTESPITIAFTVTDNDCPTQACDLNMGLWYSTSQSAYINIIDNDLNVMDSGDITCGDYDFTDDGSVCTYAWNISALDDGTLYYIDAQLYDGTDLNYDSSNTSFTINLPPEITDGFHDGNVTADKNVQFHAACENTGDNWTIYVCKTEDIVLCWGDPEQRWCLGEVGTDTTPDCNVTAACPVENLVDNKLAYIGCCDDSLQCDTDFYTTTFSISDEIIFSWNDGFGFNTYSPPDNTSKTYCETDYFDINGITTYCNALILDAHMEVFENGSSVCSDDLGDFEPGGNITAGYSCSATMSIADYDWHIDVNAPNTANTEGNTTLNTGGDRNYVVKNDEFIYTKWEPPDEATYSQNDTIDFNITGLQNSCGTEINDAIVSFWDNTENAKICADLDLGSSGFYACTGTAGTPPLDDPTETVYSSVTKTTGYDDFNSATRTLNLNLEYLSFLMRYPDSGCGDTNGCYGGGCSACTYCAFSSGSGDENQVNCTGQTLLIPFYKYDNQGTTQDWRMDLNANITGTAYWHKVSTGSGGYQDVCTDEAPAPTTQCVYVMTTSAVTIATGIGSGDPNSDQNAWAWADFVNAGVGSVDRNVTHTSVAG